MIIHTVNINDYMLLLVGMVKKGLVVTNALPCFFDMHSLTSFKEFVIDVAEIFLTMDKSTDRQTYNRHTHFKVIEVSYRSFKTRILYLSAFNCGGPFL